MLAERYFQPIRPAPAQRHALHPRHTQEGCARIDEPHGEKGSAQLFMDHSVDVCGIDVSELPVDRDVAYREHGLSHGPGDAAPGKHRESSNQ